MQTFENNTKDADIRVKSYHVKVWHTFDQLLALSQNLLKIEEEEEEESAMI